jgi:tRNA(Arg) A34 adenosine deaminase TadA
MCLASIYWARIDRIYFGNDRRDAAAIGFDDDFLYREIPLPLDQRAIPTTQVLPAEARTAFDAWAEKPDKVTY